MLRPHWILAGGLWLGTVFTGFGVLARYAITAGAPDSAPLSWPTESALRRGEKPTLLMFVHPRCVCSRASVAELDRLMQRIGQRVSARIVFVKPEGTPAGWEQTPLREAAKAIVGAVVVDDPNGVESRRFNAVTSGTSLLYDRDGTLLFHGGITAQRGQEGKSVGQERIAALVERGGQRLEDTPVFGCALGNAPEPIN